MKEQKRVNLGCWLAGQFLDVQTGKKRNLILGFLITHLAIVQGLLDLNENDLHVACEMQALNFRSLELMGLIGEYKGEWRFSPTYRPVGKRRLKKCKADHTSCEEDDELDEIHKDASLIKRDIWLLKQQVELGFSTIQYQLSALLTHMGFNPPPPPPPP